MLTMLMTGCVIDQVSQPETDSSAQTEPAPPPAEAPPPEPEPPTDVVPFPPKMASVNWSVSIQPLVDQMVQAGGVTPGSVLLVDNVKNSTNGSLQTEKATAAITQALHHNPVYTLVSRQQLNVAKQTLGLSTEDSLISRSKAIGLARYVGAHYVLYSDAQGEVKSPELHMQLMLVQTGEIIWSGHGNIQY
ncbi:penicillin-binding protein activator LpoB [Enterobacteriaceae bacterium LUAb1]